MGAFYTLAGLVSIMAAKAFGAGKVAVVDMNETNLELRLLRQS